MTQPGNIAHDNFDALTSLLVELGLVESQGKACLSATQLVLINIAHVYCFSSAVVSSPPASPYVLSSTLILWKL